MLKSHSTIVFHEYPLRFVEQRENLYGCLTFNRDTHSFVKMFSFCVATFPFPSLFGALWQQPPFSVARYRLSINCKKFRRTSISHSAFHFLKTFVRYLYERRFAVSRTCLCSLKCNPSRRLFECYASNRSTLVKGSSRA